MKNGLHQGANSEAVVVNNSLELVRTRKSGEVTSFQSCMGERTDGNL